MAPEQRASGNGELNSVVSVSVCEARQKQGVKNEK